MKLQLHRRRGSGWAAASGRLSRRVALAAMLCLAPVLTASAAFSSIDVDFSQSMRVVPPMLFGQNLPMTENGDHLIGPSGAVDPEIIRLLAEARVTSLRYPGGTPTDHFHFWQALGPVSRRTLQRSGIRTELYRPLLGPEEFIQIAIALDATPLVNANTGSATPEEAAAFAAYFNAVGFPVQFWTIGNEPYILGIDESGVVGLNAFQYARLVIDYATALRERVPAAKILAAVQLDMSGNPSTWADIVFSLAGRHIDGMSVHTAYAPFLSWLPGTETVPPDPYLYATMLGSTQAFERALAIVRDQMARLGLIVPIYVTEYDGVFFPGGEMFEPVERTLARNPTLACALYNASVLQVMMRDDRVLGAHHMSAVSENFGSLVGVDGSVRYRNPQFYVHREYARQADHIVVQSQLDPQQATFDSGPLAVAPGQTDVPMLDIVATRDAEARSYALFVVNRSLTESVVADVTTNVPNGLDATISVLNGPSYDSRNDAENPLRVSLQTRDFSAAAEFLHSFPAHSLTIIRWTTPEGFAIACLTQGGDADHDGICDAGGEMPCATGAVEDCSDNCPFLANPDQDDTGGLSGAASDGVGDLCQCGDVSDDGYVDIVDAVLMRRALAGRATPLRAEQKCGVGSTGSCDLASVTVLRAALAGLPPGLAQTCVAAQPAGS